MFLLPKEDVGESFDVSLMFLSGNVQDIRFTIGDCPAKTIIFGSNNTSGSGCELSALDSEITEMFQAILKGEKNKYYVICGKKEIACDDEKQILQLNSYRYKDLRGALIEVKNRTKEEICIDSQLFQGIFKNVVAINLPQENIAPKKSMKLVVITKSLKG